MSKKNTLYKAYLDRKKEDNAKKKLIKKYNVSESENTIIINKNSNKIGLFIYEIIIKILKLLFIILLLLLVTIGATVLLNEQLRNYVFEFCNAISLLS